ncbi:MAG: hypothetical protein Q4B67_03750 [Eubacteriales bacterium]|nr:hypothetical protein [Eubacteriales bacterium]
MILKKIISTILALSMVLALSSCTKNADISGEVQSPSAAENSDNPAFTQTAKEKELYGGDERITFTIGIPKKENVTDYENNYFTKWIEEKCNVDLEFVFFSPKQDEYLIQIATIMAANEKLPDILWGVVFPDDIMAEYDNGGYFLDLNRWLKDEEFMKGYDSFEFFSNPKNCSPEDWNFYNRKNINPTDGKRYHIGEFTAGSSDDMYIKMFINESWLKALGMAMPTDYEAFVEVLRAFRDKDPNGNGIKDEIPLLGSINTCEETTAWNDPVRWLINNWVYYNENYLFNATNGRLWLPSECDEYRTALKEIKKLVDEGLLSTKIYTIKEYSELKSLYFPDEGVQKVGAFSGHLTLVSVTDHPGLYEYTWLDPFNNAPLNQAFVSAEVSVSSACQYPERAMKLLLATASREGTMVQRFGEEGIDWEEISDPIDGHTIVKTINHNAFAGITDKTWALCSTAMRNSRNPYFNRTVERKDPVREMNWDDYKSLIYSGSFTSYLEHGNRNNPTEIVKWYPYTSQERTELGTIKTEYVAFIRRARAEFLTGVRDINSDADWNAYLEQCRQIGSEKLLSISQQAYTRMKNAS